jgi:hypothetical protein
MSAMKKPRADSLGSKFSISSKQRGISVSILDFSLSSACILSCALEVDACFAGPKVISESSICGSREGAIRLGRQWLRRHSRRNRNSVRTAGVTAHRLTDGLEAAASVVGLEAAASVVGLGLTAATIHWSATLARRTG